MTGGRRRWFDDTVLAATPRLSALVVLAVLGADYLASYGFYASARDAPTLRALEAWSHGWIRPSLPYVVGCTLLLIGSLLLVERRHLRLHHLGLTARELRRWLVTWVVAWCAIQAVLLALGALTGTPRVISSIGTSFGMLTFQLLGTGPNEELLWRCLAVSQVWHHLRGRVSPVAATRLAVVIPTVGFAFMHVPYLLAHDHTPFAFAGTLVFYIVIGTFYGLFYLRTRSLLFAAACHSLYNAPTPFDVTDDEELILQLAVVTAAFIYVAINPAQDRQIGNLPLAMDETITHDHRESVSEASCEHRRSSPGHSGWHSRARMALARES